MTNFLKENAIHKSSNIVHLLNKLLIIQIYSNQLEKQLFIVPNLPISDPISWQIFLFFFFFAELSLPFLIARSASAVRKKTHPVSRTC